MAPLKRIFTSVIILFVLATASFAASEALQIDALWSGLNNPTNGKSYSGAIVATFASDGSTAKAVWEDKEKTLPSTLGKAQFTLDSNGQAEVFGDGVYVIKVYAPTDTGLTSPLMTFDGLTYIINVDPSNEGVDSVSDLRGGSGGAFDGYILTLLGYYIPGDDGGQPLYWDESSVETDNGFSVFKVTSVTTGRWKSVDALSLNAKHAGVKTDGTDNTTEIQNYFTLVEEAIFNSGDYVGGPFTIPSTLRVIRGVGFPKIEAPAIGTRVIEDTTGSDLLITGMDFNGVAGSAEGSASQLINLTAFSNLKLIGNKFTNGFHRAIYLIGCTDFELSGNEFIDCSNGPYFSGCQSGIISKNIIDGSQQADSVFKIGIALQTFDATYGQNKNIIVSENIIKNLGNAQAFLGHGGVNISVNNNNTKNCAQGINFNRQTSGDNVLNLVINSNNLVGIATTGYHDGSGSASILTDSTQFFEADEFIGFTIYNHTDGSSATVTDNFLTTVVGVLSGGTDNDWDTGDVYAIVPDYAPAADVGINISSTGEKSGEITLGENNVKGFNHSRQGDGGGAIVIIASDGVSITGGNLADCYANGVGFSGADSSRTLIKGVSINNISGSTSHGGIKVDSPTIVTGSFKDNWITNCAKAYRLETASLPDLIVESDTESENTTGSTGTAGAIFNGAQTATDLDTTPSVNYNVRFLVIPSTSAIDIPNLLDGIAGQLVVIRLSTSNTTFIDFSNGGNFHLAGNADYTPGTKDTLAVVSTGGEWLEVSRSDN